MATASSNNQQATGTGETQVDRFLTCGFCNDIYKDPRVLPCLHSFCKTCLVKMVKSEASSASLLRCPECNDICQMNENDVDKLKSNLFIRGLLELWAIRQWRGLLCTACLLVKGNKYRVPAIARCLDCGDYLCADCSPGHLLSSTTWSHNIVQMTEIQQGKHNDRMRFLQKITCEVHEGRMLEYFCQECNVATCTVCVLVAHNGHSNITALEAVKARMPAIQRRLQEIRNKLHVITNNERTAKKYIQTVQEAQNTMTTLIHNKATAMVDLIKTEALRAQQKVEEIYRKQMLDIEGDLCELQLQHSLATSCVEISEKVLMEGNDLELLCMESMLQDRLLAVAGFSVRDEVDLSRIPKFSIDLVLPIRVVPSVDRGGESEDQSPRNRRLTTVDMTRVTLSLHHKFNVTFVEDIKEPYIRGMVYSCRGLYIADRANMKLKLVSLEGLPMKSINFSDFGPEAVAFNKDVVTCLTDQRLHFLDDQLALHKIVHLAKPAYTRNYFYPFALTSLGSDDFLICNMEEKLFFVYHLSGELIRSFNLQMDHTIISITSDNFGNIVACDWGSYSVWVYTQHGDMVRRCQMRKYDRLCTTWRPRTCVVQNNNYIYVADADAEKIIIFDEMGEMIDTYNTEQNGLRKPLSVALGTDHRMMYVGGKAGVICVYSITIMSDGRKNP